MPPEPLGWRVRASLAGAIPLCMQPIKYCIVVFQLLSGETACDFLGSIWLEIQSSEVPPSQKNWMARSTRDLMISLIQVQAPKAGLKLFQSETSYMDSILIPIVWSYQFLVNWAQWYGCCRRQVFLAIAFSSGNFQENDFDSCKQRPHAWAWRTNARS